MLRIIAIVLLSIAGSAWSITPAPCHEIPLEQRPDECRSFKAYPSCCVDYDDVAEFDGIEVFFTGRYELVNITKRASTTDVDPAIRNVQIVSPHGPRVMLGIYYEASGQRSAQEIATYRNKMVRVAGMLHANTPVRVTSDGHAAQTMIGPYISNASIELIKD